MFEGPPVVDLPLQQDPAGRRPTIVAGDMLDSVAACRPLTVIERQTFAKLKAAEEVRLAPKKVRAREAFIVSQQQRLMTRTGMSAEAAAATIEKQVSGILLASVEIPFDDAALDGKTVGDVLDDPVRFEGETLADPIEVCRTGAARRR